MRQVNLAYLLLGRSVSVRKMSKSWFVTNCVFRHFNSVSTDELPRGLDLRHELFKFRIKHLSIKILCTINVLVMSPDEVILSKYDMTNKRVSEDD